MLLGVNFAALKVIKWGRTVIQVIRYSILILFLGALAACSGASGSSAAGESQNPSQQPAGASDPACGPMTGASCEVFLAVNAARADQGVMQGWMNSAGHRANILGDQFLSMGVGVAVNSQGVRYWVQCFSGMSPNN